MNKQAISCKKSGFVLSVWMSWTRYCLCIYALKFQDEEEDGSEVEDEESESEVGEERVPTPKNIKDDEDLDTDQETDRLLGQQYNDDNGYYDQKVRNLVKS